MNRYRGPASASVSKATPSTLCQKCLKRDNYECKARPQERPYISRPSRTQQFLNPKLAPALTSDVPNDLLRKYVGQCLPWCGTESCWFRGWTRSMEEKPPGVFLALHVVFRVFLAASAGELSELHLRWRLKVFYGGCRCTELMEPRRDRKGIADEQLAAKQEQRGRKRQIDDDHSPARMSKRHSSRSVSSSSSSASISTISTRLSRSTLGHRPRHMSDTYLHTTLRHQRDAAGHSRKRERRSDSSHSDSINSSPNTRRSLAADERRNVRRRHKSRSPAQRGRRRSRSGRSYGHERARDHDTSRDRSRSARPRRSSTPDRRRGHRRARNGSGIAGNRERERPTAAHPPGPPPNVRHRRVTTPIDDHHRTDRPPRVASPRRTERSLSPFSKRLALTQAMNMG